MTTQYLVDVPNKDSSKPWIIIKAFDTRNQAVAFTKRIWGAENGYICLIYYDGEYFTVEIPNPNYTSTSNQFLCVEKFHNKADALYFAIENYQANDDGCVSLISRVEI